MNIIRLFILLLVVSFEANSQSHKATKAEADYYNKFTILYSALPEKFRGGDMDDFGARPGEISVGDNMADCKTSDCYTLMATCVYDIGKDESYQALKKEKEALKGNDDASNKKRDAIDYRINSRYGLTVKLMANYDTGEYFEYCQAGGNKRLDAPSGWDGWLMGTMENCVDFSGVQNADASFIFMGPAPMTKETRGSIAYKGVPAFPINPADVHQFKVKNIVLYVQGSKELVAEFVKSMNTAALRAMLESRN
jgi:hypothetical protein